MAETNIGGPRDAADLKKIVDRRLSEARDLRHRVACNGEALDEYYALGSIRELAVMQDLLCIVLNLPRTGAAA